MLDSRQIVSNTVTTKYDNNTPITSLYESPFNRQQVGCLHVMKSCQQQTQYNAHLKSLVLWLTAWVSCNLNLTHSFGFKAVRNISDLINTYPTYVCVQSTQHVWETTTNKMTAQIYFYQTITWNLFNQKFIPSDLIIMSCNTSIHQTGRL